MGFTGLWDVIPPSEACLYGHTNWSLVQADHQSSVGLSQSFPPKRGDTGQTIDWVPFSQYRRDLCQGLCQDLVGHLWLRGLTWSVGMRLIQVARNLLVAVSPPVLLRLGERGAMGVSAPDVPYPSASSASSSSTSAAFQVGMLFKFF